MLVTTCTNCQARFRVTPQQLNEKQGQVRCGRCRRVFNGFESLERFPDDDTGARLLAQRDAAERGLPEPPRVESAPEEDLPEIESVGTAPPIPVDLPREAAPVDLPVEPAPAHDAWLGRDTQGPPSAPLPPPASEPAPSPRPRRSRERVVPVPEPELTLETAPRKPIARAWSFGVELLLLLLGVEAAFALRAPLAQRYPVTRPALESVCARVGCSVPWSREEGLLKLEESDMQEVPGKPNEIALGARIRNLATVAQEYPHIELTLTDFTGQPAARRVLRPTDYLGRPVAPGEVMGPGADFAVQLRIETPNIKPTGYELFLFYP